MNYLRITLLVLLFSGDIKEKKKAPKKKRKKKEKKSSENDQLTGHFQSFFIYFFSSPDPRSDFFPVNQLIKKFWPYKLNHHKI